MPRLPDRFDLWVRRARAHADPARQLDYVLGALAALPQWHFLNSGSRAQPQPATTEIDGAPCLLVFSDTDRVLELVQPPGGNSPEGPPVITMPMPAALHWTLAQAPEKYAGLLINLGEDAVLVPLAQVKAFGRDWLEGQARQSSGYWIPNLTTEEEDFWQEHGL
jgi:hypothetical protein